MAAGVSEDGAACRPDGRRGRAERAQVLPLNRVRDALQLFAQQFLDAGPASRLLRGAGREDAGQRVQAAGGVYELRGPDDSGCPTP